MFELLLRLVFSLAVVLGLMLLVARVAQRRLGGRAGAPLSVLHRQAVGRHASVAVVAVGGRTLLLGVTEQQVRMITELDGADLVATEPATITALPTVEPAERIERARQSEEDRAAGTVARDVDRQVAAPAHGRHDLDDLDDLGDLDGSGAGEPHGQPFFATVLREQTAAHRAGRPPRTSRPPRQDDGPLAGSLLSPATWRRAVDAVRGQAS